ncbi:MAG: hypothetical protein ACYCWN_13020 [Ferrimicrobium sp.]|uniref:hypothetical protein n=1 Tax=Ferrimicrobium sp. TaxID=2926050 RepID=UPI0026370115|nr:hypothetical protein [Ferrimicrobium sp.]
MDEEIDRDAATPNRTRLPVSHEARRAGIGEGGSIATTMVANSDTDLCETGRSSICQVDVDAVLGLTGRVGP